MKDYPLSERKLAFALIGEPVDADTETARVKFRAAVVDELAKRLTTAMTGGHLPDQDAAIAAPALLGALIEGLVGTMAPAAKDGDKTARDAVQAITLFALRAVGVADARARGLVVQARVPPRERGG